MRKVIHKLFWIWNFDKEEKWLNEMAAKGLALISVGFCRYEFEDCVPAEYKVCLEFLKNHPSNAETVKYIEFLEETGAEHIGTFKRWAYFRKNTGEENFNLFSDNTSIIKHMTRIIRFISPLLLLNFFVGCYNIFLYFYFESGINLFGIVNVLFSVFAAIGMIRIFKKRKKLKNEQQIFE